MAQEEPGGQPVDWCLTDRYGQRQRLPKTMIFLGREECDIILQSDTVDKRHAVVTFDHYLNKFKIKDLSTANGTYVNETKITEQTYVTLEHLDTVRLGFDPTVYHVERMDKLEGGGLPAVISQGKPPAWASRHLTHMAECKGCIAEQQIHHTCGVHLHHDHRVEHVHAPLTCSHQDRLNGLEDMSGYNTWPRKGERTAKMPQKEMLPPVSVKQTVPSQGSRVAQPMDTHINLHKLTQIQHTCLSNNNDNLQLHPGAVSGPVGYMESEGWNQDSERTRVSTHQEHLDNGVMKPERDTNTSKKTDSQVEGRVSSEVKPDLDRAVKGTPLYGQPAWWGEEEKDSVQVVRNGSAGANAKPLSEAKVMDTPSKPTSADIDWEYDPQKYKSDPKYSQRYMEIPARDTDPDLESPVQIPTHDDSSTSLLSKDSLSPDEPVSVIKTQSKSDTLPDKPVTSIVKPDPSAMAFTVDLGDEKPSKKMNMSGSLSEFVPSKIRRSFRERLEKASSKASQLGNKDEPVQKEDKDLSPTQQRKLEDLWESADERSSKKGKHTKQVMSKAGGEDMVGSRDEVPQNTSGKKVMKSADRKSPKGRQVFDSSTFTKSKPTTGKTKPVSASAEVPLSDPASFLIDRMFEGGPSSKPGRRQEEPVLQVTEHALYKESSQHDAEHIASSRLSKSQDFTYLKPKKSTLEPHSTKVKSQCQRGKENVIDAEEGDEESEDADKTSEAGTYTIELDDNTKAKEEEEARQSIDHIFGIAGDGLHRPVVGSIRQGVVVDEGETFHRSDVNHDEDEFSPEDEAVGEDQLEQVEEDLDKLEWQRADGGMLSSMEVEVGSGYGKDDQQGNKSKTSVEAPLPLIKQRTFLKEDACHSSPDGTKSSSSKDSLVSMSPSERPPSGPNRKRPGTGRKLPSLPADKGSPRSDVSPRLRDFIQRSKDFSPIGDSSEKHSPAEREKAVKISSQVITHEAKMDSSRSGSGSDITLTNVSSLSSQCHKRNTKSGKSESARSLASIDTEILLKDTETVMAAMEARMVSRQRAEESNQNFDSVCGSDTSDISSTIAVVSGADVNQTPVTRTKQGNKTTGQRLPRGRPQEIKPSQLQRQESASKSGESPVSLSSLSRKLSLPCDTERSVVSDVLSDYDNDSVSVRSDASTDFSESSPKPSRKGSKGKGSITMTRPNRAFQLRRLRAEGSTESPDPPRSESSSTCTSTPKSTGRPVSGRTGSRPNSTGLPSDRKSEASLGTAIAQKGKQNAAKGQQNFARADGGRHSLRSTRSATSAASSRSSASNTTASSKSSTPESARRKELRDLKTHLKTKQDLTITGISQKSRSQPPSRSNSPKTQERNAWKRRKEYDPRKAVAQAKAKAKASSNPPPGVAKTKPLSPEKSPKRMVRSASYTNPDDFNNFGREPMGDSMSSDDLNSVLKEEAADNFNESHFQRPFRARGAKSMTSIRDHTLHSGDENSSSLSEDSPDPHVCYGMLSIRPYKSAFTPPPKSKSPASPPISPPFRRANNSHDLYCARSVPGLAHRHSDQHTQSYDNLIISSIYQLSLKLKTSTDRTLEKLRDNRRVSGSPSPVFELSSQPSASEIPAWNAANQELAAILKNLRKMDHRMQVINKALFPGEEGGSETARLTSREKKQYLQEIQRIHELAGFRPIENPEQVWKMEGEDETEDVDDNTSNVSEIEDFVEEEFY